MNVKLLLILSVFLLSPALSHAEDIKPTENRQGNGKNGKHKHPMTQSMQEMLLFFDEDEMFVTATKHPQRLQDAPAIATIVTGDEIRKMGARNIYDVLRLVPGFGITQGFFGLKEIEVRGIKTTYSEKVKTLIDGHSVNYNLYGSTSWGFDDLAVDNIKKIEIIRGPGSALYGSNAFGAVINVVTKDGKDVNGVIASGGGGSFNTGKFNLQAGKHIGDLDAVLALDYLHTDGPRLKVNRDVIGNSGNTVDYEEKLDAGLKLAYGDWGFNSRLVTKKVGPYIGATYALNDESDLKISQYFGELSYGHDVTEKTRISIKTYIDENYIDNYWELFPEGTPVPGYGTFSDGMIAEPMLKERILGAELQTDVLLSDDNQLTVGVVSENRNQYDVSELTNYNPTGNPAFPLIFSSLQDVSTWGNFSQEKTRDIWAAYIQDVWDINKAVSLTLGLRHDSYSDFGETTNPRAAVVWRFSDKWDAKALYGRAFRAPSFAELYFINNPSTLGNPQLKPEKMETYEISLGYTGNSGYKSRLSYFNNSFRDKIQLITQPDGSSKFQNTGGANVQGLEAEVRKEFKKADYMYLNYTYQWPKDDGTGQRLADVPTHKGNVGGNIGLTKYLNANLNLFISGERPRVDGDARNAVPAYALADLTLIAKNLYKGLEIRGSAHNILDQKYVDPAPAIIPGDFPREGVSFIVDASYKF